MYMGKSPSWTEASSIVLSSETVKRFFLKAAKHARAAKVSKAITHFLGFQLMTDPSLMVKRIRFGTGYRLNPFWTMTRLTALSFQRDCRCGKICAAFWNSPTLKPFLFTLSEGSRICMQRQFRLGGGSLVGRLISGASQSSSAS